jgi:hypothetical protein
MNCNTVANLHTLQPPQRILSLLSLLCLFQLFVGNWSQHHDSSAFDFMSLPVTDCFIDPDGRNSHPRLASADNRSISQPIILCPSYSESESHITTNGQLASQPWCQGPSRVQDQVLVTV